MVFITISCFIGACQSNNNIEIPYITTLGTVQDGGLSHIGCQKLCCTSPSEKLNRRLRVTALSVTQPKINSTLLFEATPDIVSHRIIKIQNLYDPFNLF